MPTYKAPVDDVMFLLSDVFHIDRYNNLPGFADATPDLIEAVLAEAAKFCEDVLTPLNRVGDKEGCKRHDDGSVTTPTGFKDAYKRLTEGGWIGASPRRPNSAARACRWCWRRRISEFLCSANMAFAMYPGLTQGAAAAIAAHGSPEQKALYLPKLDRRPMDRHHEPDRAAMRHRSRSGAHPRDAAGRRQLQDHRHQDFHLRRRARPRREHRPSGAGAASTARRQGTKGISLFIVPKFLPDAKTARSARATRVSCGSIEEKMGIHGNSTCVMNYDGATGWLIGEAEPRPATRCS